MNIFDKAASAIGRIRGLYLKGVNAPLADASAWMTSQFWGAGALAGRKPQSKEEMVEQFTSWVYICAKVNADAIAAVPLRLYVASEQAGGKKWKTIKARAVDKSRLRYLAGNAGLTRWATKGEDVEEVTDHAFLDLLQNVNPYLNGSDLRELTSLFLDLTGEAYWYMVRDKLEVVRELWPIPAQYVTPIPGKTLKDFIVGYRYRRGAVETILKPEEIIPFSFPNPLNQYAGFSCVRGVADAIYVNTKMYEFEESMFENKARPGGLLESDSKISAPELKRFQEQWKQSYEGAAKAGKTIILPPGLRYTRDYVTPDEMSFIESRKAIADEICIAFGTPRALFDPQAIRANVEAAQYTHAKLGIMPRLMKIQEKINERLLPLYDERLRCAFDNAVPEDRVQTLAENTAYLGAGAYTINEVRADLGKDPVEGGDEPLVPFNLAPLSQVIEDKPEPALPAGVVPAPETIPEEPGADEDESGDNMPMGEDDEEKSSKLAAMVLEKIKAKLEAKA